MVGILEMLLYLYINKNKGLDAKRMIIPHVKHFEKYVWGKLYDVVVMQD